MLKTKEARELSAKDKKELDNFLRKTDKVDRIVNDLLGLRKI